MKNIPILIIAVSFLVMLNIRNSRTNVDRKLEKPTNSFIEQINKFCGSSFKGKMIYPDDPTHDLANKELVMHVQYCGTDSIRIPFAVGNDHSRTWIITNTAKGLLLKHDHRLKDGSPDSLTMYGGYSTGGTELSHAFAADKYTAELIPAAASNVWTLQIEPEKKLFHYILYRNGKLRFHATFETKDDQH